MQRINNFFNRNIYSIQTKIQRQIMTAKQFNLRIPVMYYVSSPHPKTSLRFLRYSELENLSKNKKLYCDELVDLYQFHHNFWAFHLDFIEKVKVPDNSMISRDHYMISSATHLHQYYKDFWSRTVRLMFLRIKALF
eukprot:NODE_283_length_10814_cov_0.705460.p11 type:complete len:136 gc:universal NODE_283_length_10814_cov_0.705460:5176-5583(+)